MAVAAEYRLHCFAQSGIFTKPRWRWFGTDREPVGVDSLTTAWRGLGNGAARGGFFNEP